MPPLRHFKTHIIAEKKKKKRRPICSPGPTPTLRYPRVLPNSHCHLSSQLSPPHTAVKTKPCQQITHTLSPSTQTSPRIFSMKSLLTPLPRTISNSLPHSIPPPLTPPRSLLRPMHLHRTPLISSLFPPFSLRWSMTTLPLLSYPIFTSPPP